MAKQTKSSSTVKVSNTLEDHPPATGTLRKGTNPAPATEKAQWKVIAKRSHYVYEERADQLRINLLALSGGRPYVDERLSRFAAETEIDWSGGTRGDGTQVTGRKDQAHCVPYPGRIADKISQYVFSVPAKRDGADPEFIKNVDRAGGSIHQFMKRVNDTLTSCRWCWIGVDMPAVEKAAGAISQLDKERAGIRPYWTMYDPTEVVDWRFGPDGKLVWLLTEGEAYRATGPYEEAQQVKVRNLWEPGMRTEFTYNPTGSVITAAVEFPFSLKEVPFVLVGAVSTKPHVFDSIESMNRTIMDLESCSRQNYFDRVFPQMYLPASAVANAAKAWGVSESQAMEKIVGMAYPILLGEGDTPPGYAQPNAADLATIDSKVASVREAMFECVGLMLRQESKAAISAESKAWDFLDVGAVLKERALVLEVAEESAVEISKKMDPQFKPYDVEYPQEFKAETLATDMQTLVLGSQVSMPPELTRLVLSKLFNTLRRIGGDTLTSEQVKEIEEAIAVFEEKVEEPMEDPFEPTADEGEEEEAVDEEEAEPGASTNIPPQLRKQPAEGGAK